MSNTMAFKINQDVIDTDNNIEIFGKYILRLINQGAGNGIFRINFTLTAPQAITIVGGKLYYDNKCTQEYDGKIDIPTTRTTLFGKLQSSSGYIIFNNSDKIDRLTDRSVPNLPLYHSNDSSDRGNVAYSSNNINNLPYNITMLREDGYNEVLGQFESLYIYDRLVSFDITNNGFKNKIKGNLVSDRVKEMDVFTYAANEYKQCISIDSIRAKNLWISTNKYDKNLSVIGDLSNVIDGTTNITILGNVSNNITGDLSSIKSKPITTLQMQGNTKITGDLADAPASLININLYANQNITYRGGRIWADGFQFLDLRNSELPLSAIENILIELSITKLAKSGNRSIRLKCSESIDLSKSAQEAKTIIESKGFSVQIL